MDIHGKSLTQLKKAIDSKEISPSELREYFMKRIEKHNPDLNIYLTLNEDQSFTEGGPLSGLTIAIKDNFSTKNLRTTAASKVLEQFIPPYDSTVARRLKEAGVDILGKTNMDAWAHGSSGETSAYGPTKNPWNTDYAPGGSSSGSAAAVASYLAPAAIGSETAGSIRIPASWSGVIGLKPTYGRVSRYGVAAMGSSLDSPGPLTTTVEDAALLLSVIAGKDPYDGTSLDAPTDDYTTEMKNGKKFTIGVPKAYFEGATDDVKTAIEASIKTLEKMGHKVKDIDLMSPDYAISIYTIIQRAEVSSNLAGFHGVRYDSGRDKMGMEAKKRIMLGAYTLAHGYYDAFYKKALKVRTLLVEDFKRAFTEVDLIAGPVAPITAIKLGEFEQYPFFGELMDKLNEPSSIAGLPAVSLPVGVDSKGLPIGLQLIANYIRESDLLDISYQYEQETDFNGVIKQGLDKWKD
ncbi:MAG: amidase family protein [Candidatus Dojkabacteria bacterium]|nr:MAG: amidase family protein [Candidatus Dojkabacteria bacterium]